MCGVGAIARVSVRFCALSLGDHGVRVCARRVRVRVRVRARGRACGCEYVCVSV